MQIIHRDQISSRIALININNIQSVRNALAISQNGHIGTVQNKRDIHRENLQKLSAITQAVLVLLNTALIIFTLSHR